MTGFIPKTIRKELVKNLILLALSPADSSYSLELTTTELNKVNTVLSTMGNAITKLINFPKSLIEGIQFSKVISGQISKTYEAIFHNIIDLALKRSHIARQIAWNFLIILKTGILQLCCYISNSC